MEEQQSYRRALNEAVVLEPHNPAWQDSFRIERDRLLQRFPDQFVDIQHFGSTAVPGLDAKPTIDLIAALSQFDQVAHLIGQLLEFDYAFDVDGNAELTDRKWLFRHHNGHRTHHLHLVRQDSPAWHDRVNFCRLLQHDAQLRIGYARLKADLMARHGNDRTVYANAKEAFILQALQTGA